MANAKNKNSKSTGGKGPVAKPGEKKVAGAAPAVDEDLDGDEEDEDEDDDEIAEGDDEREVLVKRLKKAKIEVTGEESMEELKNLMDGYDVSKKSKGTEQEQIPGVPNLLPVRTEKIIIANKPIALPVFFVTTVKGGKQALYSYTGQRASPAYGPTDHIDPNDSSSEFGIKHINKAAAKFNAQRRKNILPGEVV